MQYTRYMSNGRVTFLPNTSPFRKEVTAYRLLLKIKTYTTKPICKPFIPTRFRRLHLLTHCFAVTYGNIPNLALCRSDIKFTTLPPSNINKNSLPKYLNPSVTKFYSFREIPNSIKIHYGRFRSLSITHSLGCLV